jgi:hypothetical protein
MPFALLSQRLYVSQFMNTYVTKQLASSPRCHTHKSKRACQEDNVLLVTDDDSAVREQGVGSGSPRDAEHEDEPSAVPSGYRYRSIEEFRLLKRNVATVIQQQLGHASLHTTTVYLRHIAPIELVETMRRRSWNP